MRVETPVRWPHKLEYISVMVSRASAMAYRDADRKGLRLRTLDDDGQGAKCAAEVWSAKLTISRYRELICRAGLRLKMRASVAYLEIYSIDLREGLLRFAADIRVCVEAMMDRKKIIKKYMPKGTP